MLEGNRSIQAPGPSAALNHGYSKRNDLYGVVDGIGWKQRKGTSVRDFCEHNLNNVLVAEDDGHVVGYYTYGLDPDHGIGQLKVNAVHPTYQGRGIGTRLAQATLKRIKLSNRIKILLVSTIVRDRPAAECMKNWDSRNWPGRLTIPH